MGKFNKMKKVEKIEFTPHAKEKLNRLAKRHVAEEEVIKTVLVITIYPAKRERYV